MRQDILDFLFLTPYYLFMKRTFLLILLISFSLSLVFLATFPQTRKADSSVKNLPPKYKKWLEEEVVYIITKKEREVFLALQTDRERDIFIEAFWKQRDPTPNTPENEFKTEHYKRIKFANERFGRETATPGWRTEMGRVYIILGEPKQIVRLENETELYPVQVWFYDGMEAYGLPSAFNVVFFKKNNAGDYILYSPIKDGPQSLMWNYSGDPSNYIAAYRTLANINPGLADVSINLIPGEVTPGLTPTMASDLLIYSKIPAAPTYKVKDSYAEKLLAYKDIIEVEYTANYIDNDSLTEVFFDNKNTAFVHYLIEPSRLSFEQYGDKFTAVLEVNGNIVDANNNELIYQFERRIPIEMNPRQIASVMNTIFSFQDFVPVIEGKYKLNVVVKNTISKEFTSFETLFEIPKPGNLWMSRILLANAADRSRKAGNQLKPFSFNGVQLRPSPRNDFLPADTMSIYLQLRGLSRQLKEEGWLEFSIYKGNEAFKTIKKKLGEYDDVSNIIEEISLKDFVPAYYSLEVTLFADSGKPITSQKKQFYVSFTESLPRPWVLSLPYDSSDNPEITYILGTQLLNKKENNKALAMLESAYNRQPSNQRFALALARAYFQTENYSRARDLAYKFCDDSEHSFLLILGQSLQALNEYHEAIIVFKNYLTRFGTNLVVLNAIGDCYLSLGQKEEALEAFEKSIQINPRQEKIKALVKKLKEEG